MTITTRLTLFFQCAVGLVLIGCSLALYFLASWHLHAQFERHLLASMDQIVAAIEVHPGDVEWEPLERKINLGDESDATAVRWTLRDEAGQLIDCSANTAGTAWPNTSDDWRLLVKQMSAGNFAAEEMEWQSLPPPQEPFSPPAADRTAMRQKFVIAVGLSQGPLRADLMTLALALVGVSSVAWVIAGLCARGLCRRALRPVHEMAQTARQIQSNPESDALLAEPRSNDELAYLSRSFNGLLRTLRESVERQARFAGDASHQLRTPLAATQVAVDVALRRQRSVEEYQRVLEIVQRRTRELTKIVETLLTLARLPAPDPQSSDIVELGAICRERIEAMNDNARANDLSLRCDDSPALLRGNSVLVAQIIDNLLDNACKYGRPGAPVILHVFTVESEVIASVSDAGHGIAPCELSQVFEPFFRSPQARWDGVSGVGLGLAIASRFARMLGGRLEVRSEIGVGSEFRLVLPAVRGVTAESISPVHVPPD